MLVHLLSFLRSTNHFFFFAINHNQPLLRTLFNFMEGNSSTSTPQKLASPVLEKLVSDTADPPKRQLSIILCKPQFLPPSIINNGVNAPDNCRVGLPPTVVARTVSPEMVPMPQHLLQKAPAVSFSETEGAERLRRFTILSQPSTVTLPQQLLAPPLRKSLVVSTRPYSEVPFFSGGAINSSLLLRVNSPEPRLPQMQRLFSPLPPPEIAEVKDQRTTSQRRPLRLNKTVVANPIGPPVPFQHFLQFADDGKFHILLAATGLVATIKIPQIIDKLFQIYGPHRILIQLVVTKSAAHFLKGAKLHLEVKIWRDEDEWANFAEGKTTVALSLLAPALKKPKNPFEKMILHNELRRWADILVIAPLLANSLAKIANGVCDNLLTLIVRLWGPVTTSTSVKKPIMVAPAMNTFMYTHPITSKQVSTIQLSIFGIEVLKPIEKVLACGDIGMGGMREWLDIVDIMRRRITAIKEERLALDGVEGNRNEDDADQPKNDDDDNDDHINDDEDDEDDNDDEEEEDDDSDDDGNDDDDCNDDNDDDDGKNNDNGEGNELIDSNSSDRGEAMVEGSQLKFDIGGEEERLASPVPHTQNII